ncbi:MAG: DNA repair protein RecO [Caldimicrobium sp.]
MLFTISGIIVDKVKIKEIDSLVTLFTPRGKIKVIAKGAQKSKRRFLNLLEELTYVRAHLRKPWKGYYLILEKVDLLYQLESPWKDLKKYFLLSYITETLNYTSPPFLGAKDFEVIIEFFKEVDGSEDIYLNKFFWEFKWLQICGLTPHLESCISCGITPKKVSYFSISRGGFLCFNCRDPGDIPLSLKQIDLLRKMVRINKLKEFKDEINKLNEGEKRDLFSLGEKFFLFHLDWEPKSLEVLKEKYGD